MESNQKIVQLGLLLFIDTLLISVSGWLYWLVISRITTVGAIGQATSIYTLVMLLAVIAQLGLEYPLLKSTLSKSSDIFGASIIVENIIAILFLPFLIFIGFRTLPWVNTETAIVSMVFFLLNPIWFVSKFVLLGASNVRTVLYIDCASITLRFLSGYIFLLMGLNALGILLSFLAQQSLMTTGMLYLAFRTVGINVPSFNTISKITKDALINSPAKLARMFIIYLSVLMLAPFGFSDSSIGVFYIALMIVVGIGGITASIAFMIIPISTIKNADLSLQPVRIGFGFTAPFVAILIVAPATILSVLGKEYASGSDLLFVLALSIFPSSIVLSTISRLNNLKNSRAILIIGALEVAVFLTLFVLLVPQYGLLGASISIFISYLACAVPSVMCWGGGLLRSITPSIVASILGGGAGWIFIHLFHIHVIIELGIIFVTTLGFVILLRGISIHEIQIMFQTISNKIQKS